jgi:hypothetical protein
VNLAEAIELSCDVQRIFQMKNSVHTASKPQCEPEKYRQREALAV